MSNVPGGSGAPCGPQPLPRVRIGEYVLRLFLEQDRFEGADSLNLAIRPAPEWVIQADVDVIGILPHLHLGDVHGGDECRGDRSVEERGRVSARFGRRSRSIQERIDLVHPVQDGSEVVSDCAPSATRTVLRCAGTVDRTAQYIQVTQADELGSDTN